MSLRVILFSKSYREVGRSSGLSLLAFFKYEKYLKKSSNTPFNP
ncbi:protein of unknown function [Tenacibaculum aestuariivivum]